jgi:hypothetical protein
VPEGEADGDAQRSHCVCVCLFFFFLLLAWRISQKLLINGKRDTYKRAVGRTTPRCGFRNRTAKPKRCHLLATNKRTRTLVWGIYGYGYRQSLSGVARYGLRRCEVFRNNLERTSWGTWWNIKAHQALVQKIPSLLSITATTNSTRVRLLEAPDVSSWNSKDTD